MAETVKNPHLKALMDAAGMSSKGLAAQIRALSIRRRDDPPVRTDHARVLRWIGNGALAEVRTQKYIAEVLSARLGRHVRLDELGFPGTSSPSSDLDIGADRYSNCVDTAISQLTNVVKAEMAGCHSGPDWASDTTGNVISSYLFSQPSPAEESLSSATGLALPTRIRDTTASFMQLDFQYGGGYTRGLLMSFFRDHIVTVLGQDHPERVQRELFAAASEVAQLLGWASYDSGRHAAAQRFFTQGLRLAHEANDRLLGGRLLSNLSHQANYLGHFQDAVQYARAAQAATANVATPTVTTMFLAMEARALASLGDARSAAVVMHRAEETFDRAKPAAEPAWISYVDEKELGGEWAHVFRDLGQPGHARANVADAVDGMPARTQAFLRLVHAASALQDNDLDKAISEAHQAIELAGALDSSRYHRYLLDFHADLVARHPRDRRTRAFRALVLERYPTLSLTKPT
ncbi:hypothetical protein [Saccharopolyspora spinosa]|uniref:Transcriptional regulator n=1 Tax=Saccharopolyspora spinosa TaxID=60894 RepID=A0A2N3Y713_SACSN|nr:hypothetical protein [Saccharopolyspora spinosa]PKW18724.1 hypothetical protein A8926_6849 [Saccharopolyspora spinosa]